MVFLWCFCVLGLVYFCACVGELKMAESVPSFRLAQCDWIGFDLDHTIVRYNTSTLDPLVMRSLAMYMVEHAGFHASLLEEVRAVNCRSREAEPSPLLAGRMRYDPVPCACRGNVRIWDANVQCRCKAGVSSWSRLHAKAW